jgi:hypothetical protein
MKYLFFLTTAAIAIAAQAAAAAPVVSATGFAVTEQIGSAAFTIQLSEPATTTVEVSYAIAGCTAEAGADFSATSSSVSIELGETSVSVPVSILDDTLPEGTETIILSLTSAQNAVLPPKTYGYGSILDDDGEIGVPARGDINKDGRSDIIVEYQPKKGEPSGGIIVWGVDGNGTDPNGSLGFTVLEGGWSYTLAGNFDGDALTDILLTDAEGAMAMATGTEAGLSQPRSLTVEAVPGQIIGSGDFDGDSYDELVSWDADQSLAWICRMAASGIACSESIQPPEQSGAVWSLLGTADFDSDRRPDLFWLDETAHTLVVQSIVDLKEVSWAVMQPQSHPGSEWKVAAIGDFNGDGDNDILWQNNTSQRLVVWFLHDLSRICGVFLNPARLDASNFQNYSWTIVAPR